MTTNEARHVFATLMSKARSGPLSERDRKRLTQARQLLRRARRPAMNRRPRKNPEDFANYKDAYDFAVVHARNFDRDMAIRKVKWYGKIRYVVTFAANEDYGKAEIVKPTDPRTARNPIELGYRSKKTGRGYALQVGAGRSQSNPRRRKVLTSRLRPRERQRVRQWTRNIDRGLKRIGRAVEVRYHRTIGRKPGYYKHEIRSRRAAVYTIPPGWVYVSSKSILITEKEPRV